MSGQTEAEKKPQSVYEVEQKFPAEDLEAVRERLAALGAEFTEATEEIDVYYRHPARDFGQSDEALRIRRAGRAGSITYKGPKIDATTKTRLEIDVALGDDAERTAGLARILEALGFTPVAAVRKRRRRAVVAWEGRPVQATLDEVDEVGTFVELELVAGADQLAEAKTCIAALAGQLGLRDSQRKSYLELLLERRAAR